jgi:hypothetical protein
MTEASTYAVSWLDSSARYVGYAELRPQTLRLEGRGAVGAEGLRTIPYREIASVDLRRVNGTRTVALETSSGGTVVIASLDRPGSLAELADRLRRLTDSPQG